MAQIKRAMILSAGLGTRLRPLTLSKAKPAVPFLKLPLIAYPLFQLHMAGCREFVINTHYQTESVKDAINTLQMKLGFDVVFVHESPFPLGSGGGVKNAHAFLCDVDNFFVANSDALLFSSNQRFLDELEARHIKHKGLATLHTTSHNLVGTQFGGVVVGQDHKILGFSKKIPQYPERLDHFTGFSIYNKRIFNHLPEGESSLFGQGIASGLKCGEYSWVFFDRDVYWFETGTLTDYYHAQTECLTLREKISHIEKWFFEIECALGIKCC